MSPSTVLVLGGYGETGRRVARLLAERTDARIVLAGRDAARAAALAAQLGTHRATGIGLDATDLPAVTRALHGVEVLVNAAVVPEHVPGLARATVAAGCDWLDFQINREQARSLDGLAAEISAAGRCFVTQAGFHPGVPAALVRWAAAHVDELHTAWVAGLLLEPGGLPATSGLDELVAGFRDFRGMRYEDGRWEDVGSRWAEWPTVDFGAGFGRRRTFPMEFDELYPLPDQIPTLRRLGFSITMDTATNVASALVVPALTLAGSRPWAVSACSRLLAWTSRTFARPPYGCVVTLGATGLRDGLAVTPRVRLFHENGYDLTAIAGESMIEQLIAGDVRRPGLHRMGQLADPDRLLADLAAMGAQVDVNAPDAVPGL